MLVLISKSWLVQCKSQFHSIIRWFALFPNWWCFLVREGWAGLLGFWSGDSQVTLGSPALSELTQSVISALRWLILQHPKPLFSMECQPSPCMGPCQAWEYSRWHSFLLKVKRPSILWLVCWFSPSFISWSYRTTLTAQLGSCILWLLFTQLILSYF